MSFSLSPSTARDCDRFRAFVVSGVFNLFGNGVTTPRNPDGLGIGSSTFQPRLEGNRRIWVDVSDATSSTSGGESSGGGAFCL